MKTKPKKPIRGFSRSRVYLPLFLIGFFLFIASQVRGEEMTPYDLHLLSQKIILAESSGHWGAVGDGGDSRGLFQIHRSTWKRLTKEPWSRAFERDLNYAVGMKLLREIARNYGKRATPAKVAYTFNTGRYCFVELPAWTRRHRNKVYRKLFLSA